MNKGFKTHEAVDGLLDGTKVSFCGRMHKEGVISSLYAGVFYNLAWVNPGEDPTCKSCLKIKKKLEPAQQ
jgi:hypothetical protein